MRGRSGTRIRWSIPPRLLSKVRPALGLGARSYVLFASALGVAAITACYTGPSANDGFLPTAVPDPATDESATDPSGLPCDVAKVLSDNCTSCHGTKLYGAAKTALLTRDDLMRELDGRVVAEIVLERMKDDVKPMPPGKALAEDQIAILESWVDQGMPQGTCGEATSEDAPPEIATTCTSGTHWTRGTHESKLMKPGGKCIQCHTTGKTTGDHDDDDDDKDDKKDDDDDGEGEGGPLFYFAGTVFPSAHDEDDCNGSDATATTTVVLTGADGQVLTLPINAAGNFYTKQNLAMPVTAKVVSAAGTRKMKEPIEDGDCNGCHTATSASPGRIVEKR